MCSKSGSPLETLRSFLSGPLKNRMIKLYYTDVLIIVDCGVCQVAELNIYQGVRTSGSLC